MSQPVLYVSSDQYLWVLGLVDNSTAAYVTGATVSAVITDSAGTTLATVSLTYQSGSQVVNGVTSAGGNYRGLLAHSVTLTAGQNYTVSVTITNSTMQLYKQFPLAAQYDAIT